MMSRDIVIERLSADAFATFGDVIEVAGEPTMRINRGKCARHHDLADLDIVDGAAGISLFDGTPYALPLTLDLLERHPLGSQAFVPMSTDPFLVIAAEDENGEPARPRAWVTDGLQGVNYHRGTWHGVLTPLARPAPTGEGESVKARFAVVDRIGPGDNLEEAVIDPPWRVVDTNGLLADTLRA